MTFELTYHPDEMTERHARSQGAMKANDLDSLLIYDSGASFAAGSVRYLSGYSAVATPLPAYMVLVADKAATLCFTAYSSTRNYHAVFGFDALAFTVPSAGEDMGTCLARVLSEQGVRHGRVGVDGLTSIPFGVVESLRRTLPDVELVDATRLIEAVRNVKSPEEIARFRAACELSHAAMATFEGLVEPGANQDAAVGATRHEAEAQGAEELGLIHGCGEPWLWGDARRHHLQFQPGDLVSCEVNARCHGYFGQVARTWVLGSPSSEQEKLISAVRAAEEAMLLAIRPGMTGREVFGFGLRVVQERGFDWSGVRYGHGLGLTISEGFDFADAANNPHGAAMTPIPEGATGVFHPYIILVRDGERVGNAIWGNPWVLGAHGAEPIVEKGVVLP